MVVSQALFEAPGGLSGLEVANWPRFDVAIKETTFDVRVCQLRGVMKKFVISIDQW